MIKIEIDADREYCRIEAFGKPIDFLAELSGAVKEIVGRLNIDKTAQRNTIDAIAFAAKKELGLEDIDSVVEEIRRANIGDILNGI